MDEINLDFLKTPPKQAQLSERSASPFVFNEINVGFGKKKNGSKRLEMAQTIAKVDELVQEIDKLKTQNNELQQQLKDFQTTAQQVQELYIKEKREHAEVKSNLDKLQLEYQKMDIDLTNKNMVNEQMKARLAEYEGRPINFNNLVVKYVKVMNKLEGEDILKYSPDKDLVERLREYCANMKLKIPPVNSPKKYKSRGNKVKTDEAHVQCNILAETSTPTNQDCLNCTKKPKMQDKNTQCSSTKRDQASQYISTMITRQTNTEKVVQKHVQTMFPEPQKAPPIDDILNVYTKWSNIRSVSPLLESPSRGTKELLKTLKNIGTCTMLCNIRRKIDYLPQNNSSNIKQEIFTPSASPTPPSSNALEANRARVNSLTDNSSQFNSSILNLFNATTNSALGQLSSNAFNELWQIFGKMLLSLLQTSNAGIANTTQNSSINQQQFLDWLLELYVSSQPQNTSSAQTQTVAQTDSNVSTSPLCFNDSTMLSANVVRPQAQKTMPARTNRGTDENNQVLRAEDLMDNNSTSPSYQQNTSTSPIPTIYNSNLPIEGYSQDSNSMDIEVEQIASNTNEQENNNIFKSKPNEIPQIYPLKVIEKPINKSKSKHKILDEIQELIPEIKLNKKKRKALKRLLKKTNHRKKSFETRKCKDAKQSGVDIFTNENEEVREEEPIETAVDFLKTFAIVSQNNEETCTETEKIFLKQNSNGCKKPDDEFTFIKPSSSFPLIKPTTTSIKQISTKSATKRKKSKSNKTIVNKYQLLFGDSDSEFEEQEQQLKPVIKSSINLNNSNSKCNVNNNTNDGNSYLEYTSNWPHELIENSTYCNQQKVTSVIGSKTDLNSYNESSQLTIRETAEKQFSLPNIATPVFENSSNTDISQEMFSIPELPTPILKSLESRYFPESLENTKYCKNQNIYHELEISNQCYSNIENEVEKDLELSSDDESMENINKMPTIKIVNNSNESNDSQYLKEKGAFLASNNYEKFVENCAESRLIFETNSKSLPILIDNNNCQHQEPNTSTKQDNHFEKNVELFPSTITSSEEISTNSLLNEMMSNAANNIQTQVNLNAENFANTHQQEQSHIPIYSKNFEKNLELGPSTSTKIKQIFPNNIKPQQNLNSETFFIDSPPQEHSPSPVHSSHFEKDLQLFPSSSTKLANETKSIVVHNIKPLPDLNNETFSNTRIDSSDHSATLNYCSDFEKDLELSSDNESFTSEIDLNNLNKIRSPSMTVREETNNVIDSEESESYSETESENEDASINKFKNSTRLTTEQRNNIKDSKESDKTVITNSKTETENNSVPLKSLKKEDKQEKIKQIETKSSLDDLTKDLSPNKTNFKNLSESKESCKQLQKLSNSNTKSSSLATANNSLTNKPETKENSLCWSVITISDSSLMEETLNSNELHKTPENKTKMLGLSSLKLLNLNNTPKSSKNTNNEIMEKEINSKLDKTIKDLPENKQKENTINSIINYSINEEANNFNGESQNEIKNINKYKSKLDEVLENSLITQEKDNAELQQDLLIPLERNDSLLKKQLELSNPMDCLEDEDAFNDSLSLDNELMIDEEPKESEIENPNSSQLTQPNELANETINSSNISTLLNSTLFHEVLTESLNPIVEDLLKEREDKVMKTSLSPETKPRRGRKRKSECVAEVLQPCKRSQRLQAKQKILEETLNISKTPIELGKYTRARKNVNNIQLGTNSKEDKQKHLKIKSETIKMYEESIDNEIKLEMGFFRERHCSENVLQEETNEKHKTDNKEIAENETTLEMCFFKERRILEVVPEKAKYDNNKPFINSKDIESLETETALKMDLCRKIKSTENVLEESANENDKTFTISRTNNNINADIEDYNKLSQNKPAEEKSQYLTNFVYTDSPQSPPPFEPHNDHTPDNCVIIPPERLPQFMPQQNNLTLFDSLINLYRYENQKHVLETLTTKERQRQENILGQFKKHLETFCYNEMELDPDCTSIRLINKLLSISNDYKLIQKALITIAQNAEGGNVPPDKLPSVIQEMPPSHLSKCLQRLFSVLRNFVTKNSNFCQDLIDKIESLLFNAKQIERLSLQATLNLTQLYLMACKIQEFVQMPKHPARLFIAKCLYFYVHKSSIMIHEVMMWYPTVLPYREDKTYDRSDALISVLKQILMSTKYEMDKPELHGKQLLSKLRYEYHFEPFKPTVDEVIIVLVEKLKNSKFYNISLAYGLLSKRLGILKTQNIILNQHLMPLANEYYVLAMKTDTYDKRIAVLLEIISMIIKPFPIETNTKIYFKEFARFLNAFDRPVIQEAALCSILRLQRFDMVYCYNLLRHFKPTFDLNTHTQAMLNTFLYRRPLTFWKNLKSQNPINLN